MSQNKELAREMFSALLAKISDLVPDFPLRNLVRLVRVGEFKIAIENLCTNLHEDNVRLPDVLQCQLAYIAKEFEVDKLYWDDLCCDESPGTDE